MRKFVCLCVRVCDCVHSCARTLCHDFLLLLKFCRCVFVGGKAGVRACACSCACSCARMSACLTAHFSIHCLLHYGDASMYVCAFVCVCILMRVCVRHFPLLSASPGDTFACHLIFLSNTFQSNIFTGKSKIFKSKILKGHIFKSKIFHLQIFKEMRSQHLRICFVATPDLGWYVSDFVLLWVFSR